MKLRLKDLREDADLKQRQLAEKIYCSTRTYSGYEQGRRRLPLDRLIDLARFYHTSTDYILGLTDDPSPSRILKNTKTE